MGTPLDKEECEETEDWLVTYADAITLLMAFFVMLLSFSKIDIPKFEEAATGIAEEIGMGPAARKSPMLALKDTLMDMVTIMEADEAVEIRTDDKGIIVMLSSGAFYQIGLADLREDAKPVLRQLAGTLMAPPYDKYMIEADGHTDDDPISTARFPSNWELSAGRAAGVVRYFIELGMDRRRFKAAGFAETRPKVPNRLPDGTPIKENQAENRRVVLHAFPLSPPEEEELFREWSAADYEPKGPVRTVAPPLTAPRTRTEQPEMPQNSPEGGRAPRPR